MTSELSSPYQVLAINAFDGGSHHSFLRGLIAGSCNDWTVLADKPVHWKWRMRSSALTMAEMTQQQVKKHGYPDLVFCTDMLDLPTWRGLLNDRRFAEIPVVNYFHESQWTYPMSPQSRVDHHFGYTNLLSAIASDACVFNSCFHEDTFLKASERFVRKMPDSKSAHDWAALRSKSHVIPPGFDLPGNLPTRSSGNSPVIGWVSRWESDKRPDRFAEILRQLDQLGHDFQLVLLGARSANSGNSACEAMHAGAIPVVPNRLAYPELVPSECLYDTTDQAIAMLLRDIRTRQNSGDACRGTTRQFDRKFAAMAIDKLADVLIKDASRN